MEVHMTATEERNIKRLTLRRRRGLEFIFVALFLVFCSVSPLQADQVLQPGSMCVRDGGSSAITHTYATIENRSPTSSLSVYCPIVRQNFGKLSGPGEVARGLVRVDDRHPTKSIWCNLHAMWLHISGPTYLTWTSRTGDAETGVRDLPFDGFVAPNRFAYYYYHCTIPPMHNGAASRIVWYSVVEK
jgi:hypothetical protein